MPARGATRAGKCREMERTSLMWCAIDPAGSKKFRVAEELNRLAAGAGTAARKLEIPFGGHTKATVAEMALGAGADSSTTFPACAAIRSWRALAAAA